MSKLTKVLVVGATGGCGREVVSQLLKKGHAVTAFSRHADSLLTKWPQVTAINGDASNPADIDRVVPGHDAVIITLGISENPIRVRLLGSSKTPSNIRSEGTQVIIEAMKRHGVKRLVVLSSFGVGPTKNKLRRTDKLVFNLLLKPQIQDTEIQETRVRQSSLEWVLAQPVHLHNDAQRSLTFASSMGETQSWGISRKQVAEFLTDALNRKDLIGQTVALSGAKS